MYSSSILGCVFFSDTLRLAIAIAMLNCSSCTTLICTRMNIFMSAAVVRCFQSHNGITIYGRDKNAKWLNVWICILYVFAGGISVKYVLIFPTPFRCPRRPLSLRIECRFWPSHIYRNGCRRLGVMKVTPKRVKRRIIRLDAGVRESNSNQQKGVNVIDIWSKKRAIHRFLIRIRRRRRPSLW